MATTTEKCTATDWETSFNAKFDRVCAAFWHRIEARTQQAQPPTTQTIKLQPATFPKNCFSELTNPATHMAHAAASTALTSSGPGTHLEVPLPRQPHTQGRNRTPEHPWDQDPQIGTCGKKARVPVKASGRGHAAHRLRKPVLSWTQQPTRTPKRPPKLERQSGETQETPTYKRSRKRRTSRPEPQTPRTRSSREAQPKQPRTAQCPPVKGAQTPLHTTHRTSLSWNCGPNNGNLGLEDLLRKASDLHATPKVPQNRCRLTTD
ncbi:Hypothetical predicted protein [Pelobates cultripes]|uniref:Uncharacterized protein n=1 Tax=Pelobates cultripes TaxID=61616 RepID=A0AAD1RR29_PELCU|nr:Hypothetical predicted protein [Pelobates cultripes]